MKVTVLGTGAYGLALASLLVENKNEVVMWTTFEEEKKELLETRKSPKLEGYTLDKFFKGNCCLKEGTRNKIGIIFDKSIPQNVLNIHINTKRPLREDESGLIR